MLRRDYILRMIEEFVQTLARLKALKNEQRWGEVSEKLEDGFKKLLGEGAQTATRLSEEELRVRLMQEGPTQLVREKTLMLATLLKEAGDVAAAEGKLDEGRNCHLKSLHLLLGELEEDDIFECPAFIPKIEALTAALRGAPPPLPVRTCAMLMQHYERAGEFAKAEDALFAMLEAEPDNGRVVDFGIAFYHRLLAKTDDALTVAGLPRAEVEDGLKELQSRLKPGA
ncbi:MAG TPA: DUF6483 family protein [Candidatus Aquilonibacter sp.]|nr:DUF6483 family protein [Candidatus Aquilonibacter sp.]